MSLESFIALLSATTALAAAAGALFAARASQRSAIAAHEAARHAETVDRRGILRDLMAACHRLVAEAIQTDALIEELKTEYRLLSALSGQSGSNSEKRHILQAESKQKEILALQEQAQRQIQDQAQLLGASEQDLTLSLSKFDGYLVQTLRIKSSLEREIASVAGSNRIHRENRTKVFNQWLQKPSKM
jgi:hypothetical protein